ncbi:N-acetylmuramoyl-L-alanine amidase [candidate division KSB1 bacterium]|nr:N-acetylmuramoyl-L-alanine amidase [candidate division KSB1 bacterium]
MSTKRIAIAAGHYSEHPGAIATTQEGITYVEHDLAKQIVRELFAQLIADGSELIVEQFRGNLNEKIEAINRWKADLAVEIHFNDAPDDSVVGTETLYNSGSELGKFAAESILNKLVAAIDTVSRGAKVGWYQGQVGVPLYFLNNTFMPAVIVEVCYLHRPDIEKVIGVPPGPIWYVSAAEGIAAGIRAYLDEGTVAATDDVTDSHAPTIPTGDSALIRVPEIDLMQQLARFKNVRYRNLDDYLVKYPIPVAVGDRMIQGQSHSPKLDCITFVESYVIGGLQRLVGPRLTITEQQHQQLMIIGDDFKPDSPIHVYEELRLGTPFTNKQNGQFRKMDKSMLNADLAWSVFQAWRSEQSGHSFIIYKSQKFGNTFKHLILECNYSDHLNGVGVRRYGNFDDDRFASILTGVIPEAYWVDADYLSQTYPELYGIKLDAIVV